MTKTYPLPGVGNVAWRPPDVDPRPTPDQVRLVRRLAERLVPDPGERARILEHLGIGPTDGTSSDP